MSRLDIKSPSKAQTVVDNLYRDVERRIAASPPGLCPVDMNLSFLQLCHAQSCGKCVPCRIGLGQLSKLMAQVLDGTGTMETIDIIEKTARTIVNTADCAIGRDAARLVVDGLEGFRDDYEDNITALIKDAIEQMQQMPIGNDLKPLIPTGTRLVSARFDHGVARIEFSEGYLTLKGMDKTVADYGILMTLSNFWNIRAVEIRVNGVIVTPELAQKDIVTEIPKGQN